MHPPSQSANVFEISRKGDGVNMTPQYCFVGKYSLEGPANTKDRKSSRNNL